jgi:short-subunit dehydrogenase
VFLPLLLGSRGHVVKVASLAGRYALPGASVYAASKHAVVAFSESLNAELEERGVVVTAVCPGFVDTEGFPQPDAPRAVTLTVERVAGRIVDVVARREVGTVHLPAWAGPLSAIQTLAPSVYRRVAARAARRYRPRARDDTSSDSVT